MNEDLTAFRKPVADYRVSLLVAETHQQLSVNYRGVKVDRILLLNQRSIADESPQQVMTPDHLQQAYRTLLNLHSHQDLNPDLFC